MRVSATYAIVDVIERGILGFRKRYKIINRNFIAVIMNFKKLLLVVSVVLALVGTAEAQQSKSDLSVEFRPNWTIQLQGGAAYTLGEAKVGKLISPAANLSASYKFHSMLGVRVGVGGWQAKGAAAQVGELYKFNLVQGNADLMLDLSTMIGGFNHRRVANVYMFAGFGAIGAFNNDQAVALAETYTFDYLWTGSKFFAAGRFGAGVDFRCSDHFSVGIEGNANLMSDKFNSKKASNVDWQLNLLAGVTYRFGKNYRPSKVYAEAKAKEEAARIAAEKAAAEKAAAEKAAAEKAAAEKAAAEKAAAEKAAAEKAAAEKAAAEKAAHDALAKEHSIESSFLIGSYKIRSTEGKKIDALAQWLNENKDFSVLVVGYADKQTGTSAYNMELSKKRANAVQKRLVSNGVEAERITVSAKGDTEQVSSTPEKNRVVLCIVQ